MKKILQRNTLVLSHFFSFIKLLLIQGYHFHLERHDSWLLFLVRNNYLVALVPSCVHPTYLYSALPCLFRQILLYMVFVLNSLLVSFTWCVLAFSEYLQFITSKSDPQGVLFPSDHPEVSYSYTVKKQLRFETRAEVTLPLQSDDFPASHVLALYLGRLWVGVSRLWCCGLGEPYLHKVNDSFNREELEGAYIFTLAYSKILFKDLEGRIKEEQEHNEVLAI